MAQKTIYLNRKREKIFEDNFGKGTLGEGQFSEWIGEHLDSLEPSVADIKALKGKKEEYLKDIENIKEQVMRLDEKIGSLEKAKEGKIDGTTPIEF